MEYSLSAKLLLLIYRERAWKFILVNFLEVKSVPQGNFTFTQVKVPPVIIIISLV